MLSSLEVALLQTNASLQANGRVQAALTFFVRQKLLPGIYSIEVIVEGENQVHSANVILQVVKD